LLIAVLPFPALVDWAMTSFRTYHGSNIVRTVTGLLLGYGYALGLIQVFKHKSIVVILIGAGYGITVFALLYVQRTAEV
jgi:hypothetical protein